ncbi:MAG: hypothetical protein J5U17_10250 [Candidatus Methanoperedens sp.]|nr:hypothetical protein [Candidatus Methanoperedens sp.]MCE8426142.1 hypothetical protein [Candidatus Methanoperedens sp.]MCE8428274.1 hypothetical protein [Candidatus Methanoperedens sp.]
MKPLNGYQFCPFCGGRLEYAGISSGHIFPWINSGQMYLCAECGYQGGFIVEVDDLKDAKELRGYLKEHKMDNIAPAYSLPKRYWWLWWSMLVLFIISIASRLIT